MSFLQKYGEPFGLETLSLLSFYGTLSTIVLSALILGVIVQAWKGRSGGIWAGASLVLSTGGWIYALNSLDSTLYAVSWAGENSWAALAVGVSGITFVALLAVATVLPASTQPAPKSAPIPPFGEPTIRLSAEPIVPVLPRRTSHSFRRKFFVPTVVLGVVVFLALGIMSVEKRQFDIFLRALGIIEAEAPAEVRSKTEDPSSAKKKSKPKTPAKNPVVVKAQNLLLGLGYDAGSEDGTAGGKTEEAVRAYQAWEGLPRDGKITEELVTHLQKVKMIREGFQNKTPLIADYQPHANMCIRGTRAWYRSRTTNLSIDNLSYSKDKYSIDVLVWFSYPGEELERVRANTTCKYSRYREEMPEAPYVVAIKTGAREETLSDLELACFSRGQPC